jgi:hypothetical protein
MRAKGTRDALNNYQGKKSGAGWTAATNIVISPVIGLIPAIACANRMPSDDNLNYEDTDLMQNGDYKNAYKRQAHKTKKKKIWTSYGVSTGVWLVLFLLI